MACGRPRSAAPSASGRVTSGRPTRNNPTRAASRADKQTWILPRRPASRASLRRPRPQSAALRCPRPGAVQAASWPTGADRAPLPCPGPSSAVRSTTSADQHRRLRSASTGLQALLCRHKYVHLVKLNSALLFLKDLAATLLCTFNQCKWRTMQRELERLLSTLNRIR